MTNTLPNTNMSQICSIYNSIAKDNWKVLCNPTDVVHVKRFKGHRRIPTVFCSYVFSNICNSSCILILIIIHILKRSTASSRESRKTPILFLLNFSTAKIQLSAIMIWIKMHQELQVLLKMKVKGRWPPKAFSKRSLKNFKLTWCLFVKIYFQNGAPPRKCLCYK